jgi:arginyl-tRNA synthetase
VIGPDARKTAARLQLVAALKQALANGLSVLGVAAPERMDARDAADED